MNRQLDGDIAQLVFGWKEGVVPPDANKQNGGTPILLPPEGIGDYVYPALGKVGRELFVPQWSAYHDKSLELVKALRSKPYFFEFLDFLFLKFNMPEEEHIPKFGHQTVYQFMLATPEQICEAALEAVKLHNKLEAR